MTAIIESIKKALVEVLNVENADNIKPSTTLFDELSLDSTSVLELLMVLEDEIDGLSVDPETLEPQHFETVESLAIYIDAQLEDVRDHVG
ncbi:acyl carrier protein [Hazenella sp. IB182357]|uniref:Acyl carrier protein n=1 Tax=Polycladospora coralii TaxID=2771432 RepID=A0A926NFZ0_9BACL|nr:phosphopantetheine-binding protein [Polycladospora coralii]MBD1372849.1 acyl carrier protein [Polycladospora coralii]MBS7529462.1 acyl carrier protein [Polycladospora coralii]